MDEEKRVFSLGGKTLKKVIQTCMGCGVTIQSENPNQFGFVPPHKQAESSEDLLCRRCFRIRHYQEILPIEPNSSDYLQVLSHIAQTDSLIVQVVDLFDFEGSLIPGVHRHIGKNPLYLLANKIDLFPKSTKHEVKEVGGTVGEREWHFPCGYPSLQCRKRLVYR